MKVYQTRNHRLILDDGKEIELKNSEHKFLIGISSGNLITYKELSRLFYGYISRKHERVFICLKYRFEKKTGLKIKNVAGRGYILQNDIDIYYI